MESFFSTVKSELAERFDSYGEAKMELFDYIEVFYNQRRRHSTLGQISPAAFERRDDSSSVAKPSTKSDQCQRESAFTKAARTRQAPCRIHSPVLLRTPRERDNRLFHHRPSLHPYRIWVGAPSWKGAQRPPPASDNRPYRFPSCLHFLWSGQITL